MAGNVWEWVGDVHTAPQAPLSFDDPIERGVLRGGAYGYGPDQARTWYQASEGLQTTCPNVGFRTVLDAEPLR